MPNNNLKNLCALHRAHYRQWKCHRFDPVTGDRWPGDPNVFFNVGCGSSNMRSMRDVVEREWSQKNREQIDAIVSDCSRNHGCADTPDILEWCTAGARLWRAESGGLRFTVDALLSAPYPDTGHGAGSVDLVVERLDDDGDWEPIHESRHTHPRPARLAAHDFWKKFGLGCCMKNQIALGLSGKQRSRTEDDRHENRRPHHLDDHLRPWFRLR